MTTMQKRLLDILADPDNPDIWPLKLKVFKSEKRERKSFPRTYGESGRLCRFYCYRNDELLVKNPLADNETFLTQEAVSKLVTLDDCKECFSEEIIDGIIYHEEGDSLKWFIIDQEIPVMFPVSLRDEAQEKKFIKRYENECGKLGIVYP